MFTHLGDPPLVEYDRQSQPPNLPVSAKGSVRRGTVGAVRRVRGLTEVSRSGTVAMALHLGMGRTS